MKTVNAGPSRLRTAIRQPLDPSAFVADLKGPLGAALGLLDEGIAAGTTGGVKITTRRGELWISVPPTPHTSSVMGAPGTEYVRTGERAQAG